MYAIVPTSVPVVVLMSVESTPSATSVSFATPKSTIFA